MSKRSAPVITKLAADIAEVKRACSGRWPEILVTLGGIPADRLDGKNHPCPKCRGTDRFRMIDQEAGAVFCNHCFAKKNGDGIAALQWVTGKAFKEVCAMLTDHLGTSKSHAKNGLGKEVATYDYRDEGGELLYQVVRFDPKDFRQRTPKPGGGWNWSLNGVRRVPFRLPELLAAGSDQTVFVCEGEKDVSNLVELGLVATCNAGGAGKWLSEFSKFLDGHRVVILPDKDEPGRKHAQHVAAGLSGIAVSVKLIELPGSGKDVSDWLAAGGNEEELFKIIEAAPEWVVSGSAAEAGDTAKPATGGGKFLPEILTLRQLYDQELPLPEELIQGILHKGSKLSFGGATKGFKTWTLQSMALAVAGGVPWLGFATRREKVLLIDLELQPPFVKRRLETLQGVLNVPEDIEDWIDVWTLRGHSAGHREIFPRIIDRIAGGGYGLVILDPVYKLYGEDCDENSAGDVAALMNSIERLATQTGAAVAFGAHFSKGNQATKNAIDRVSGSGVFARDPDTLLNLTAHDEGDGYYAVEATLRNFPPLKSFVVRWRFPLFERRSDLDPTKLKTGRTPKYTADMLLDSLRDGMTGGEWQIGAEVHSDGAYSRLRHELEEAGKVEKRNGKWWKTQILRNSET